MAWFPFIDTLTAPITWISQENLFKDSSMCKEAHIEKYMLNKDTWNKHMRNKKERKKHTTRISRHWLSPQKITWKKWLPLHPYTHTHTIHAYSALWILIIGHNAHYLLDLEMYRSPVENIYIISKASLQILTHIKGKML